MKGCPKIGENLGLVSPTVGALSEVYQGVLGLSYKTIWILQGYVVIDATQER